MSAEKDFIKDLTHNFGKYANVVDESGRTLIHYLAMLGRTDLIDRVVPIASTSWHVHTHEDLLDSQDTLGRTALHYAFMHNNLICANLLLERGARTDIPDRNGCTAFDFCLHQVKRKFWLRTERKWSPSIFMNSVVHRLENGVGHQMRPKVMTFFANSDITIVQIAACKYHTLLVCDSGDVFSSGKGAGGRLGHGNEDNILTPHRLFLLEDVRHVAVSEGYSIFSTHTNSVYCCGVLPCNEFKNCRIKIPHRFYSEPILPILGLVATPTGILVYTKATVRIWGINRGQAGVTSSLEYLSNSFLWEQPSPESKSIFQVSARADATAILFSNGDVVVFYKYTKKKLRSCSRNHDPFKVVLSPGKEFLVVTCDSDGTINMWRDFDDLTVVEFSVPSFMTHITDFQILGKNMFLAIGGRIFYCPLETALNLDNGFDNRLPVLPVKGIWKGVRIQGDPITGSNIFVISYNPLILMSKVKYPTDDLMQDHKTYSDNIDDYPSNIAHSSFITANPEYCPPFVLKSREGNTRKFSHFTLYVRLPFFRLLFRNDLYRKESEMTLDCGDYALDLLYHFVMGGRALDELHYSPFTKELFDIKPLRELLTLGDYLLCDVLKEKCSAVITRYVHLNNVIYFAFSAHESYCISLQNFCFEFIMEELQTLYELDIFKKLTGEVLEQFIAFYKSSLTSKVDYPIMDQQTIADSIEKLPLSKIRPIVKPPLRIHMPFRESHVPTHVCHPIPAVHQPLPSPPTPQRTERTLPRPMSNIPYTGWTETNSPTPSLADIMAEQVRMGARGSNPPKSIELLQTETRALEEIRNYYESLNGGDDYVVTDVRMADSGSSPRSREWPARRTNN